MNRLVAYAAVDILGGKVVTLTRGRVSESRDWSISPIQAAKKWQDEGADWLHVIDLDAVFRSGSNRKQVEEIIRSSKIPVQYGGGVRSSEEAESWTAVGAKRVIVGTAAFATKPVLSEIVGSLGPQRVAVALDFEGGEVVTEGWTRRSGVSLGEALRGVESAGVNVLLATAVEKDGAANGPDFETMSRLRYSTHAELIAAGGIRDSADMERLACIGVQGAVLGRPLYEGTIKLGR